MNNINFYRAFEERYRGSRELIKLRLNVYLPFVLPLKGFYGACQSLDLGCGRGEWLELMQDHGIDARGVDSDKGMLEIALERGLNASYGDAIEYLQELESESQVVVSGFHLAEHLLFDQLRTLIQESHRVLKPGGLLILETPNPENIVVGTANFYLDPTHQNPIPSQLLSFMAEYAGYEKVKILRLQQDADLSSSCSLTLLNVLNGVSPDYSVVAQKMAPSKIISSTSPSFTAEYGISLEQLASKYDHQIQSDLLNLKGMMAGSALDNMAKSLKESDVDRAARGEQIEILTKALIESDVDRAARGEQIEILTKALIESDVDRAAQGEQIEILTKALKESDVDRAARGEQIEILTKALKESDVDRAARGEQIEMLTKMLKECEAE